MPHNTGSFAAHSQQRTRPLRFDIQRAQRVIASKCADENGMRIVGLLDVAKPSPIR